MLFDSPLHAALIMLANTEKIIKCHVNNKISLKDLIDIVKEEKWIAKKYNIMRSNCQKFGAKIIKILKATRMNERDKIRIKEKMILPNSLIEVLSHNEKSSIINNIGKIPIIGLLFDIGALSFLKN